MNIGIRNEAPVNTDSRKIIVSPEVFLPPFKYLFIMSDILYQCLESDELGANAIHNYIRHS